jgi:hypothetical protein
MTESFIGRLTDEIYSDTLGRSYALAYWMNATNGDFAREAYGESIHHEWGKVDLEGTCSDDADTIFTTNMGEYIVLRGDEAYQKATEYIEDTLYAFNSHFLAGYTGVDESVFEQLSQQYESANPAVRSLIEANGGLEGFVGEAIAADGLGHFISFYDGEEHQMIIGSKAWSIFRVN